MENQTDQLNDLEEAKLIISLKNDEINSVNNKIKMIEKRANIKVAECNYKLEQQKTKLVDLQKKMQKAHDHVELQKSKSFDNQKCLKEEIQKLKQNISELNKNQRHKERQYKAHLYEESLKIEKQRETIESLKNQLKSIKKIFSPKQILQETQKKSIQQLPNYMDILKKLKEKEDQINTINLQMENFKAETLARVEESFQRLGSYEQVMEELTKKNEELQTSVHEKEIEIMEHQNELQSKNNILEEVEVYTNERFSQLTEEIMSLRQSMKQISNQEKTYQELQLENQEHKKFVFNIQQEFEIKEEDYIHKIEDLEAKILKNNQIILIFKEQYEQLSKKYEEDNEHFQNIRFRLNKNVEDKEEIIVLVNNSLKEMENQYELKKAEAERYVNDLNDLIKRKRKLEEELVQKEHFYQLKSSSLLEEIDLLKKIQIQGSERNSQEDHQKNHKESFQHRNSADSVNDNQDHKNIHRKSLLNELQFSNITQKKFDGYDLIQKDPEEPNWFELYENSLRRHNKFIKEVHFLLEKNIRNPKKPFKK